MKLINNGNQEEIRKRIISEFQDGADPEFLAAKYNVHEKSIYRMVRVYKKRKTYRRKKGSGRPDSLSTQEKHSLASIVDQNPFITARQLQVRLGLTVSLRTIRNYLKSLGYVHKKLKKKITLTGDDILERLTFARRNQDRDWSNVIFADEAGVWLFKEAPYGWVKRGEDKYFFTESHPSKIKVFACIGFHGKVWLETYRQNLNSELYCDILEEGLIPTADEDFGGPDWILVHDNHPTHTSYDTTDFLAENNVVVLDWPVKAQDINPIENLSPHLKRRVFARNPKNIDELENFIHEVWNNLEDDIIFNIFDSIYTRIEELVRLGGRSLKY
jgi:transposase